MAYNITVEADEVNTILYRFKADKNMDTREFGIVIDVFYTNVDNDTFATTFFNETVSFVEPEEGFDPRSFFSYVALVGIISLLLFVLYKMLSNTSFAKKMSRPKKVDYVDVDTKADINQDWIPSHLTGFQKPKKSAEKKNE